MSATSSHDRWLSANQRYLMQHVRRVRQALIDSLPTGDGPPPEAAGRGNTLDPPEWSLDSPPALDQLCELFSLSNFERDILLLCAGMDFDSRFPKLCAAVQGDDQRRYPTFSLALSALSEPHWSAISPQGTLRHWQLVELEGGRTVTHSPLRLDERILHYLTGVSHMDERLAQLLLPVESTQELVSSHKHLAEEIAATWIKATVLPIIQLCGQEQTTKQAIAAAACDYLNLILYRLPVAALPTDSADLGRLIRLWQRETFLGNAVLYLDTDGLVPQQDPHLENSINQLAELSQLLIVSGEERRGPWSRPTLTFDVEKPTTGEQRSLWQRNLGDKAAGLNGRIDQLVAQFNLPALTIQAVADAAQGSIGQDEPLTAEALGQALWQSSRLQARPRLDDMAQRIQPAAGWDDLVLPEGQKEILQEIALHVRQRTQVYDTWGFRSKGNRGLGISALFAGGSGTGKTMAAEVLANELQLDLYRIDLSAVVSKYIGETEKNLRRVFDAAEIGGAILLFDEADALFGKRSDVKDSHDRHANIEVSYLLQRMEAYRGLAILTSNIKSALDPAFLRRLRFVVDFPFPNAKERAAIWRRIFPQATPTEGLDTTKLAQLNVPGGNIRNIALYATFLAAEAGEPVKMTHLLHAARREYSKLQRKLTSSETEEWV